MSGAGLMEPDNAKSKMKKVKEVIPEELRIPGRPARAGDPELPTSCRSVRKLAMEAGWDVEVIYARGITSTPKLVHIYALRMVRGGQRVSATWYADATADKLTWKFTYAGMIGTFVIGKKDGSAPTPKAFPFTLSSDEMKGVLKGEPMKRILMMDGQYDAIQNEDKADYFIPEAEFRAPYKKAPRPKKEKQQQLELEPTE
jgi:hypothetical protein